MTVISLAIPETFPSRASGVQFRQHRYWDDAVECGVVLLRRDEVLVNKRTEDNSQKSCREYSFSIGSDSIRVWRTHAVLWQTYALMGPNADERLSLSD